MIRGLFWAVVAAGVVTAPVWIPAIAHADPEFEPAVVAYTGAHSRDICAQLAVDPNNDGVQTVGLRIVNGSRLTPGQAGQVIGLTVRTKCPQWAPQVAAFAATTMQPAESF